jgi:hypothetical protein
MRHACRYSQGPFSCGRAHLLPFRQPENISPFYQTFTIPKSPRNTCPTGLCTQIIQNATLASSSWIFDPSSNLNRRATGINHPMIAVNGKISHLYRGTRRLYQKS